MTKTPLAFLGKDREDLGVVLELWADWVLTAQRFETPVKDTAPLNSCRRSSLGEHEALSL